MTRPPAVAVTLTWPDFSMATYAGTLRQNLAVKNGTRDARGYVGDGYDIHVRGCLSELAVARFLFLPWSMVKPRPGGPDVGRTIQVRSASADTPDYRLIINEDDPDGAPFVFAVGKARKWQLYGWLYGREKLPNWLKSYDNGRPPAYYVPNESLRAIAELVELVENGTIR